MYVMDKYTPIVNIELENGIYVFDSESATGKTRLCKLLKNWKAYGEPVDAYTYNDFLKGYALNSVLTPNNKVILLDRYDLYKNEGHELINMCASKSVVLIDCKTPFLGGIDDKTCFIDMTEDKIEVTE